MRGRIEDGQEIVIVPVDPEAVVEDDVVLVRWRGSHILHLVLATDGARLQIGNTLGKINGWVERTDVVGRVYEPGARDL